MIQHFQETLQIKCHMILDIGPPLLQPLLFPTVWNQKSDLPATPNGRLKHLVCFLSLTSFGSITPVRSINHSVLIKLENYTTLQKVQ